MTSTILKLIVAAGAAVLVFGGGAIGLASAQAGPTTPAASAECGHGGVALGVAAQAIGITPQELRQELPGKSLAQVAQAHNKSPGDVATALQAAANARIDHEVVTGELTGDQAAQRKQTVDQAIAQGMNRVWPTDGTAPARPTAPVIPTAPASPT